MKSRSGIGRSIFLTHGEEEGQRRDDQQFKIDQAENRPERAPPPDGTITGPGLRQQPEQAGDEENGEDRQCHQTRGDQLRQGQAKELAGDELPALEGFRQQKVEKTAVNLNPHHPRAPVDTKDQPKQGQKGQTDIDQNLALLSNGNISPGERDDRQENQIDQDGQQSPLAHRFTEGVDGNGEDLRLHG